MIFTFDNIRYSSLPILAVVAITTKFEGGRQNRFLFWQSPFSWLSKLFDVSELRYFLCSSQSYLSWSLFQRWSGQGCGPGFGFESGSSSQYSNSRSQKRGSGRSASRHFFWRMEGVIMVDYYDYGVFACLFIIIFCLVSSDLDRSSTSESYEFCVN